MDEVQERAEIERLFEEQLKDDTSFVSPEFNTLDTIPIETLVDSLAVAPDGEIVMFGQKEKGTVLIGSAAYHGTVSGYVNHKCKCDRCKGAQATRVRRQRAQRKAKEEA
jgi:hypothetical protein